VGLVALALFASLAVASAAAPRARTATGAVTLSLSDSGKGRWSILGDSETGSLAMNYSWHGRLRFPGVPGKAGGTLTGTWVGDYVGTRLQPPNQGGYHCSYSGKNITITLTATLARGPGSKHVTLTLDRGVHRQVTRFGFFPNKGGGAQVNCATSVGADGPPHFSPGWLFRDTVTDHGTLTSQQAVIVLPSTVLKGKATVTFPREIGSVDSALRDKLNWRNVGTLKVTGR
jgi:hypothetical protein